MGTVVRKKQEADKSLKVKNKQILESGVGTLKREYILEGLDCANCAAKIERKVNELNGIIEASLSFATKTLVVNLNEEKQIEEIVPKIKEIVKRLEPEVVVREKQNKKYIRKVLILEGLCCANCASKIERETKSVSGVKNASIDFVSKKLIIDIDDSSQEIKIMQEVEKIVKRIEPDVKININDKPIKGITTSEHEEDSEDNKKEIIRIGIGALIFAFVSLFKFSFNIEFLLYLVSYFIIGGEVLLRAGRNIAKGEVFDENFLMALATIGAFSVKQFPEGVAVMLFYQIGEMFQDIAVNRSRKSIASLMDIRPDFANILIGDELKRVSPEEVGIGDIIVVRPGEKIPLDGIVVKGESMLDTSALTGESVPREVIPGGGVLGGFINKNGLLTIKVEKDFQESTVAKILDLVENASSKKAPTENFITKFARYYTPAVVISAVVLAFLPPLFISGTTFSQSIYRALVFLVVSCPCALVVSIPLGFFGGIGGASKNGILVKGGNYLEALNNVEIIVFDKTGTLTKGVFKVTEVKVVNDIKAEELLKYAAYAECYSNHPIATSILKAYEKEINQELIESYNEIAGCGTKIILEGKEIIAGNLKLMQQENIHCNSIDTIGTVVYIAVDRKFVGYIIISDEIKEDSLRAVKALKSIGIKKTVMLTGDNKRVGTEVSSLLGIDEVHAELLPDQKVEIVELLNKEKSTNGKLVFVGDGINDAPVLARADIGIAMGGIGSDAAIEAADVIIMTDEPSKIASAIMIAKRTKKIVMQNIIFALGVKVIILVLGTIGIATMGEAVFGDVGVALIAVLNAMRAMKTEKI